MAVVISARWQPLRCRSPCRPELLLLHLDGAPPFRWNTRARLDRDHAGGPLQQRRAGARPRSDLMPPLTSPNTRQFRAVPGPRENDH